MRKKVLKIHLTLLLRLLCKIIIVQCLSKWIKFNWAVFFSHETFVYRFRVAHCEFEIKTITAKKQAACMYILPRYIARIIGFWPLKFDKKRPNNLKSYTTKTITNFLCQPFKKPQFAFSFLIVMDSGKMYIRLFFCDGQLKIQYYS